jgi:hypothetical protein
MHMRFFSAGAGVLALSVFLAGCNHTSVGPADHAMGEKVGVGPLTYTVIETNWSSQLGDGFKIRSPQQRFLAITLSITNGGGSDASIPLLSLDSSDGMSYVETDNGDGLDNWLGLIRTISPAQTMEGKILFDVPLGSYRLRLTDGAGAGAERYSWVSIPLRLDVDTGVQTPTPGDVGK